MGQFLELKTILKIVDDLKYHNKIIVTTNGCFDLMHVGHYDYLLKAKKFGDILIVGINSDNSVKNIKGPSRPINNEIDRARLVAALDCVDYTFLFDESTPDTFISIIRPDIHVKGDDYDINTLPEANTVLNIGAELKFVSLTEGKSTTNIIEKIINSQK